MQNYLKRNKKTHILFLVMFFGLFFVASQAHALSISPVRMEISGDPGETLQKNMILINESNVAETFYSSYANFEAQGETGNPAFVEPKNDLGTWISTASSITLKPGESKTVPFNINILKNAEPGGHFATIFWGTGSNKPGEVSIGAKTGLLILLSVNGNVKESAGFLNFNTLNNKFWYSTLPVSFEYRFKNDGGDRIKPQGQITIRDTVFLPAEHLDANPSKGNILPASTRKFQVDWINYMHPKDYVAPTSFFKKFVDDTYYQWKNFAVGLYSANLDVIYGTGGEHAKKMIFFFVFPWQLVLVMAIVILVVYFGGKKLLKRYNKFIVEKARQSRT